MANRYWVGGDGTWNGTATTHWSATSGGAGGASAPLFSDDVYLDAASGAGVVTVQTGSVAVCQTLTCTGFTGTLAFAATTSILRVGASSGGTLTLAATMAVSTAVMGSIRFTATTNNGGAGWAITTAGKTLPNVIFVGTLSSQGKWVLQDALTSAGTITLTSGTLDLNSKNVTCDSWSCATTNNDLIAGTQTITQTGPNTFGGGNRNYSSIVLNGAGIQGIGGNNTCVNLTRIGTASPFDAFSISTGVTVVSGTLTLGGGSVQGGNRLSVYSSVVGDVRPMPAGAVVIVGDVDFVDFDITGAPSWTNASNAYIGDGGENGPLIVANRTAPVPQTYAAGAAGNWSDLAKWTSRVPLPQDDVTVGAAVTGTLTADIPRLGASVDFTGFTGTWQLTGGTPANTMNTVYGSLILSAAMTLDLPGNNLSLAGRGNHVLTSAGQVWAWSSNRGLRICGGTYTLTDALIIPNGTTASFSLLSGTLNTNGMSVQTGIAAFSTAAAAGSGGSLLLGTTTWTIFTLASAKVVAVGSTDIDAAQATLVIVPLNAADRSIDLGDNNAWGAVVYTVPDSPGSLEILSSGNTIGTLSVGSGRSLILPSGAVTTVTGWDVAGQPGSLTSVSADTPGTQATVASPTPQESDYLTITDISATGGPWAAGGHSVNGGGNSGWVFSAAVDATLRWAVAGAVAAARGLAWPARAVETSSRNVAYSVTTEAADSRELEWPVLTGAEAAAALAWALLEAVGLVGRTISWPVRAGVDTARGLAWRVRFGTERAVTMTGEEPAEVAQPGPPARRWSGGPPGGGTLAS